LGFQRGREEGAEHTLLNCSETKKWNEFVCSKWLNINEDIVYRRITNCTNIMKLKNTGK
jgi:hypothetical protein